MPIEESVLILLAASDNPEFHSCCLYSVHMHVSVYWTYSFIFGVSAIKKPYKFRSSNSSRPFSSDVPLEFFGDISSSSCDTTHLTPNTQQYQTSYE
uniref:Uncharacterized protein n=1 Tax=Caenorhabditis brenneri TaxID=135651 RepID=B6VBE6_CAEBE|nr:hypothetical protein Cbre_JD07.006 [Caenorhabditis brenneri]